MDCNEMKPPKEKPPMTPKTPHIEDFGNGIFIIWKI